MGEITPVRILIVEDNEPDAYLVRTALRAAQIDFELTHAQDGLLALAFARFGNVGRCFREVKPADCRPIVKPMELNDFMTLIAGAVKEMLKL